MSHVNAEYIKGVYKSITITKTSVDNSILTFHIDTDDTDGNNTIIAILIFTFRGSDSLI